MKNKKVKIIYEPEDDVLNIWLSKKPYDYGEDNGDLVITHYTKDDEPVYIEVLFASRFFKMKSPVKKAKTVLKDKYQQAAIPHRIK